MNRRYAIFDLSTGAILRFVTCPSWQLEYQHAEGEGVMDAPDEIRDTTHRVDLDSGEFVSIG